MITGDERWADWSASQWDSVIMDQLGPVSAAIIERLGIAGDCSGAPPPGYVNALYEAAGLVDVAEWNVGVELVTRSPAQYWR